MLIRSDGKNYYCSQNRYYDRIVVNGDHPDEIPFYKIEKVVVCNDKHMRVDGFENVLHAEIGTSLTPAILWFDEKNHKVPTLTVGIRDGKMPAVCSDMFNWFNDDYGHQMTEIVFNCDIDFSGMKDMRNMFSDNQRIKTIRGLKIPKGCQVGNAFRGCFEVVDSEHIQNDLFKNIILTNGCREAMLSWVDTDFYK